MINRFLQIVDECKQYVRCPDARRLEFSVRRFVDLVELRVNQLDEASDLFESVGGQLPAREALFAVFFFSQLQSVIVLIVRLRYVV